VSEITACAAAPTTPRHSLCLTTTTAQTDRSDAFAVFQHQSVGPRHFIDAITHDFPASPSFQDGHQVQRVIEAAVDADRTGAAKTL
jgi:hypothetical protein